MNIESQASISELLRRYEVDIDTWGADMCETDQTYIDRAELSKRIAEMSASHIAKLAEADLKAERLFESHEHMIGTDDDPYHDVVWLARIVGIIEDERAASTGSSLKA